MHDSSIEGSVTPTDSPPLSIPVGAPTEVGKESHQSVVPPTTGLTAKTNTSASLTQNRPCNADVLFSLESVQPLTSASFPNPPRPGSSQTPATIGNVRYLLETHGIHVRYDVIKKRISIAIPGYAGTPDNADNVALSYVISLANINGMPTGPIHSFVDLLADRNPHNPVADWIVSKPWDGEDRLKAFKQTLMCRDDFPEALKDTLMYRWMLSTVAAALKTSDFKGRGVLTLLGSQGLGKTSWASSLVPDPVLRERVVKLDHHLDAHNKDSVLTAVSHWIVEIGELDGSFKKDIARLKGFLTNDRDKVRRPYARTDSEYPRRTVFMATVNDPYFLVDSTGNSRWWTIPVVGINYRHGIDMQQVFAQLAVDFHQGIQWWLTPEEEQLLETHNKAHRAISAIRERVLSAMDLERVNEPNLPAMSPIEVLIEIGIKNPGNPQCKECAAVLREHLGEPKRNRGFYKWRVPLKKGTTAFSPITNDDELY